MCSNLRRKNYSDSSHLVRMGLRPGSKIIERYTHISSENAHQDYLKTQGIKVPEKEQESNLFEPIKCWKCGAENTPTTKYCSKCSSNLTVESAERDFNITEVFKSNFAKLHGVNVDEILKDYKRFKMETISMEKFLDCFNGNDVAKTESIRQQLPWDDGQILELLQYLISNELIGINNGNVHLLNRSNFKQFIQMQKRYLEW